MRRSNWQKIKDTIAFPLRAVTLFEEDKWSLSSLQTERYDYCAAAVRGECLDVGCGRHNRFIQQFLNGRGKGVDVFPYDGLRPENLLADPTQFPFPDAAFDSVTFIANLNHVPTSKRDAELAEAWRCLRPGGNIIVTMGAPLAELLVHRVVALYDRLLGTRYDVDSERGMHEEEQYYLTTGEILTRLHRAGFKNITRRRFGTQWGLNAMFVGWKAN